MNLQEKLNEWTSFKDLTKEEQNELKILREDDEELFERFNKDLEFGTGGLRALMGMGSNRLNRYTIRQITYGYGQFLIDYYGSCVKEKGVVIAYDVRNNSRLFALEAARTLATLGIKSMVFNESTTTPELSFSVDYLKAIGGIVITASHNPSEYNGYKIYDLTGCQVTPFLADKIINYITQANIIEIENADDKYINFLSEDIKNEYKKAVKQTLMFECDNSDYEKIKVLYTPLHGTGNKPIFSLLNENKNYDIYTVVSQLSEDPLFSTVKSPNPEDKEAFTLALKEAKIHKVDLILGTDPDCDRVGAYVKVNDDYVHLNGNQIGSLMIYYMSISNKKYIENLEKPFILKTIVTSNLGTKIAEFNGIKSFDTLTGFKFIGEKINEYLNKYDFMLGYEESYGYLAGTHARDKDGIVSALLISEMVSFYKKQGKTLVEVLNDIYLQFGFFEEDLISYTCYGREGLNKINEIMNKFRKITLQDKILNNFIIFQINDYLQSVDNLPKSDVIKIIFENDCWIAARPSGTEPKIKFYIGSTGLSKEVAHENLLNMKNFVEKFIKG